MRLLAVALFVLFGLAGCDAFRSDPGSFELTTEGAVTDAFTGKPVVVRTEAGSPSADRPRELYVRLAAPGNARRVDPHAMTDGQRLPEGRYVIVPYGQERSRGEAWAAFDLNGDASFLAGSGEIIVTRSEKDWAEGLFSFVAYDAALAPDSALVSGSFEADLTNNRIE
jgi:hypothetical protein